LPKTRPSGRSIPGCKTPKARIEPAAGLTTIRFVGPRRLGAALLRILGAEARDGELEDDSVMDEAVDRRAGRCFERQLQPGEELADLIV